MLPPADLCQLLHAEAAQRQHRAWTAHTARLQLVERRDVFQRQEARRDLAVDLQRGLALAGGAERTGKL